MFLENKILCSISKFAKDNHVYFEFHLEICLVKSYVTNKIVLQGRLKDSLYAFDDVFVGKPFNSISNSSCICSLQCNLVSLNNMFELWHNQLGHPTTKIVHHVPSSCNTLLYKWIKSCFICFAYCIGKSHKLLHFASSRSIHGPWN